MEKESVIVAEILYQNILPWHIPLRILIAYVFLVSMMDVQQRNLMLNSYSMLKKFLTLRNAMNCSIERRDIYHGKGNTGWLAVMIIVPIWVQWV